MKMLSTRHAYDFFGIISQPTEEMCEKAIRSNPNSIRFVKNPSPKIQELALSMEKHMPFRDKEIIRMALQRFAITWNAWQICYLESPSHDLWQLALDTDIETLRFCRKPTKRLIRYAITKDPTAILYLNEQLQTQDILEIAVSQDIRAIEHIHDSRIKKLFEDKYYWWKSDGVTLEHMAKSLNITRKANHASENPCLICKDDDVDLELNCGKKHRFCFQSVLDWYFRNNNEHKCLICFHSIEWSQCAIVSGNP